MTIRQLLVILKARRLAALLLLIAIVGGVAIFSLLQPKQYVASAAVLVDVKSSDPLAAAGLGGYGNSANYMATQVDLIQSERVAIVAIHELNLEQDAGWRALWQASTKGRGVYEAWLSEQLRKKLEVRPSRESSVINIGYMATDPEFAASVANAFVRSYITTTLALKVEPAKQYSSFFDERAKQIRAELGRAQGRLSAYQQANGIVATDERLDVEAARLSELSSQVVVLQGVAAESTSRQHQAGSNSQEVLQNPLIAGLTADLAREEARLTGMKQRLGEQNPDVLDLSATVQQMRSKLESETRRVTNSLGLNSNADRSRLASALAALSAQRANVLRLRGQRDEAAVLLRDVDSAQRAYDAALARTTQSSMESQSTFTNVSIVQTATPPPVPTSPRVLLNIAVAFVVGSLAAIGFAMICEYMDRRLRFESDAFDVLGFTMLVNLPKANLNARRNDTKIAVRTSRLLSNAPGAAS